MTSKHSHAVDAPTADDGNSAVGLTIRDARAVDLDPIIAIDAEITGLRKVDYWFEAFHRYATRAGQQRHFLVAEVDGRVEGYILGEIRDWEFGEPPCGWVFVINVRPDARLRGIGTRLLDAICAGFKRGGVTKVRTLLARDNNLVMSFFRAQGMTAAPFIALERNIE